MEQKLGQEEMAVVVRWPLVEVLPYYRFGTLETVT